MRLFKRNKPQPKEEHPSRYSIVSPSPFASCEVCQVVYEREQGHVCSEFLLCGIRALQMMAQGGSTIGRSDPPQGDQPSLPVERVDHRLIGDDCR